ncbi:MAG: M48 family metalloprotease [Candidatus Fimimonas sp.]
MNKSSKMAALGRNMLLVLLYCVVVAAQVGLFLLVQKIQLPQSAADASFCVAIAMVLGLVAFVVANIVRLKKLEKKYDDKQLLAQNIDEMNSKYLEAQANYLATEKSVIEKKNKIILHKALLSAYFVVVALACALGTQEDSEVMEVLITLGVIAMFLSPLCWIGLLTLFQDSIEYSLQPLAEKQYPQLYQVVAEAEKTLGCNKPFKIYPVYNSSIAVSSSSREIQIHLDCEETLLFTRDELYNILLHEIAHVVNSDTRRSRSLEHFSYACTHFGSFVTQLFFGAEFADFTIKKAVYYIACSRFYEQAADEAVKKYGDGQTYINGTAKGLLLALYRESYKPEMDFGVFENTEMPSDYFVQHLNHFKQSLPQNLPRWDYILRNRIQSRQDTHPTFAMRMKFLGVEIYAYTTEQPRDDFYNEQHNLLTLGCKLLEAETKMQFKQIREQQYLPAKKELERYRSMASEGKIVTVQDKTEFLPLLFSWDRPECLKLCNEVLAEYPKNSYACYYKGLILAENFNKDCVDLLYAAAEGNFNLAEEAIQAVGEFACNVGDEELLQRYRDRATSDIVSKEERLDKNTTHLGDSFTAQRLSDEVFNEILQYILQVGGKAIKKVYAVSRGEGADMLTSFLLVWNIKGCKVEDSDEVYQKVFSYLDRYGDGEIDYNFELRAVAENFVAGGQAGKIVKEIMKTPGALVFPK